MKYNLKTFPKISEFTEDDAQVARVDVEQYLLKLDDWRKGSEKELRELKEKVKNPFLP